MKDTRNYEEDLASIRTMMERSVKVVSLSGLSGMLAGVYALAGAALAYYIMQSSQLELSSYDDGDAITYSPDAAEIIWKLLLIASVVLGAALLTGFFFSQRKAKKYNQTLWNAASRKMFFSLAVPLVTGGIFVLAMLYSGFYELAAPATLLFYGLALIHSSDYTFQEIKYLGFSEIILGLLATLLPGYGLIFWAIGFGILHLIYGALMYYRHDQ